MFADHSNCARGDRLREEASAVGLGATQGEEHVAGFDRATVDSDARRIDGAGRRIKCGIRAEKVAEFHVNAVS